MDDDKYHCIQCERPEEFCYCERYCALCQGFTDVRLWADGLYYCRDCRESCGYKTPDDMARSASDLYR